MKPHFAIAPIALLLTASCSSMLGIEEGTTGSGGASNQAQTGGAKATGGTGDAKVTGGTAVAGPDLGGATAGGSAASGGTTLGSAPQSGASTGGAVASGGTTHSSGTLGVSTGGAAASGGSLTSGTQGGASTGGVVASGGTILGSAPQGGASGGVAASGGTTLGSAPQGGASTGGVVASGGTILGSAPQGGASTGGTTATGGSTCGQSTAPTCTVYPAIGECTGGDPVFSNCQWTCVNAQGPTAEACGPSRTDTNCNGFHGDGDDLNSSGQLVGNACMQKVDFCRNTGTGIAYPKNGDCKSGEELYPLMLFTHSLADTTNRAPVYQCTASATGSSSSSSSYTNTDCIYAAFDHPCLAGEKQELIGYLETYHASYGNSKAVDWSKYKAYQQPSSSTPFACSLKNVYPAPTPGSLGCTANAAFCVIP